MLAMLRPGWAAPATLALLAGLPPLRFGLAVLKFRLSGLSALSTPSIMVWPLAPPTIVVLACALRPMLLAVRLELASADASPACASGAACLRSILTVPAGDKAAAFSGLPALACT